MLDRKFVVENESLVQENCRRRSVNVDVSRFVELDRQRRALETKLQDLQKLVNEVSEGGAKAQSAVDREALIQRGRELRQARDDAANRRDDLVRQMTEMQLQIPNLTHPDVPVGGESANVVVTTGAHAPRDLGFQPKDHLDLGQELDLLDFEAGSRVAGHAFYFLKNQAVLLELALQSFAVSRLVKLGFTPFVTPDMARNDILTGAGFTPRGPETQIYSIEGTDLSLIATAEITLAGFHAGHVIPEEELPIRLCGISHCFRTEAGAHGRASRGLYRVHQFTKVEMFVLSHPDRSDAELEHLRDIECRFFDELEIPYRVVGIASGELGAPAYRKYDLEAWMPGRNAYGEVTSASNCTDYQARRLNIRFKPSDGRHARFVHTLNGTAIANSRAMVSLLENHQQRDGSVVIPTSLRPYTGFEVIPAIGRR
jgi:seryl-tRNA synthetase